MKKELNIEEKRKAIQSYCEKHKCGVINPKVFENGYPIDTAYVYGMLAAHGNGKIAACELLSNYEKGVCEEATGEEAVEVLALALWNLYEDGFIEICTLTDKVVSSVYDQLFWR